MFESKKTGNTISPLADAEVGIDVVMLRLVRVLHAWMVSDRWLDYLEQEIIGHHTVWKRMILCNKEFTEEMVRSARSTVRSLNKFFLQKYKIIDRSLPSYAS